MKILYLDVENSPSLGYYYDLYKEGNIVREKESWFMLSISWKWEHEARYYCRALCDYKGYQKDKKNDKALMEDIWKLLDEADLVIGHNSDRFDLRKIYSRFLVHGIKPPSPFKTVDTLKVLRRVFAENSNRLDAFARAHKLGAKVAHTGANLWFGCMDGHLPSWKLMKKYNIHDVRLTVAAYKLILPYITNHPWVSTEGCPNCGSHELERRGFSRNKKTVKQRLQCQDCGAWTTGDLIKNETVH